MIVADVNLLVAASRQDHVHHHTARPYLVNALGHSGVIVPDAVWSGFLRVVTSHRIFRIPTPLAEALAFVHAMTSAPGYRSVAGLTDSLAPFLSVVADSNATGDLVPDAYIAAVAIANGCPVASFDRDFRRFNGLQIDVPAPGN